MDHLNDFISAEFASRHPVTKFIPGQSPVPVTGKVFGPPEVKAAVKNYTKALGKSIATDLREAVRKG